MAYVGPVHRPTRIRHALSIRLLSPDQEDLVIAKANCLEIWRPTEDGIRCLHTKLLYGTVSMLQRIQPKNSETDLLFVGTDRFQYICLVWDPETQQIESVENAIEDLAEPHMRHSQSQNKCLVDPTGHFMVMLLWEGVLNVFRHSSRRGLPTTLRCLDQIRLTELYIKASAFMHSRTGHPRIAFLYTPQLDPEEAYLAVYRLTKDDKGVDVSKFDPQRDRELDRAIKDPRASLLIPVPFVEEKRYHVRNSERAQAHLGGLLVLGETLMTYFDSLTYTSVLSALPETRIYVAWAAFDGLRYFVADEFGRLDLLTLQTTNDPTGVVVTGITVSSMNFVDASLLTSHPSSLVYMHENLLFLASDHGNPQLLRVDVDSRSITLVQTLSNNGPILDFAIMDMGSREGDTQPGNAFSSGQTRVVAGCGAYRDGSLRSIRSGVGLDDHGIIDEIQNTRGLFTLRSRGSVKLDTVILSFISETRVLIVDPTGGIEEVYAFQGLRLEEETLLAANLPGGKILQVTPSLILLLDAENGGVAVSTWKAPAGKAITSASANTKWLLIAVDGLMLTSFSLRDGLVAAKQLSAEDAGDSQTGQVSCLHVARDLPDTGVIGWWSSGSFSIVDLATLRPLHGESLRQTEDSASVARDIALVQLHRPNLSGPTLLVALEDGHVVSFKVLATDLALSGRKSVILGSSPARLHVLPQTDGTCTVFATTEHASLIYSSEGRAIFSATTADDATFVAPFDAVAFPDSIVMSSDKFLRFCRVDKERLTHVTELEIGETVRRVAYSPGLKAFGLGCIRRELLRNEEVITSTFKLVDEIIFRQLGEPFVLDASASIELVESVIRAELPDSNGSLAERFIVGTSFAVDGNDADDGDFRGRLLVLGVDNDRQVYQIVSHKLTGACRCLGVMGSHVVAGLSKTVVIYSYEEQTTATGSLRKVAAYRPASFPIGLDIVGDVVGVADLMQSLSLVKFVPPQDEAPAKLEELGRHYEPGWATSVCALDDDRWLEADAQGNLVVLRRNLEAPLEQDQHRLEVTSEINIGEQINCIRRLHVSSSETDIVSPKAFLASVDGTLYLYGDILPEFQDLLMTFQSRLQEYVCAPGNISFDAWRAFRNQAREGSGPFRFIDGEMVERFLDLDEGKQESVCAGLGPSVEYMRNMVEELRRLH